MDARRRLAQRFRIESVLAVIAAALVVLTMISHEWIEVLTGWDPDGGNGAVEWGIVVVLAVAAVVLGSLARADWRKVQALPA